MLRVLEYGPDREAAFRPITAAAIEPLIAAAGDAPLLWIDAPTPEPDEVAALADAFQWHPLIREDLEHGDQRQKAEQFPRADLRRAAAAPRGEGDKRATSTSCSPSTCS